MDVETMERLFGVLALLALAGAAGLLVGRFLRGVRPVGAVVDVFDRYRLESAWLVATVATAGSLYLSEGAGFHPCRLCWIQRGFMYPLVVVLGAAMFLRSPRVRRLVVPWALVGSLVSTYHYLLEWFPEQLETNVCDAKVPCSAVAFRLWGFVTIPFMAGCGFLFIASVLTLPLHDRSSVHEQELVHG